MKSFNHSELRDFLEDESFRLWLHGKATPEIADAWEQFPQRFPERAGAFHTAKETLLAFEGDTFTLPPARVGQNIRRIMQTINQADPTRTGSEGEVRLRPGSALWRWAAAAVVVLSLLWMGRHYFRPAPDPATRMYTRLIAESGQPLAEVTNTSDRNRLVTLADGSSVLLTPDSRISYPKGFDRHEKREVYLVGEAFFEVAKNPEKPFFVYADNLITKVLGTSFTVRANGKDQVHVTVKTGRVSVFTRFDHERRKKQESAQLIGLVLTPNQRVMFNPAEGRLERSLVDSPTLLDLPIQRSMFAFSDTPVSEVFASLEKAYGIEIVFDEEVMKNCYLTASLDDEPLFEKLSMICRTLDAQYEQMEGKILISSKGCL
ncbi:FecR family protein [Larkinella soli]|uniref:FecR family protein n=1 Tax=Larkinella soli TaxID=1770527 RepID=UPI000FFC5813|nr:FecR family protein [Larkinella soli]